MKVARNVDRKCSFPGRIPSYFHVTMENKNAFPQLSGLLLEFSVNIWPRVLRRSVAREAKYAIRYVVFVVVVFVHLDVCVFMYVCMCVCVYAYVYI